LVRDLYVRELAAKLSVPVHQVARMVREAAGQAQRNQAKSVETSVVVPPPRRVLPPDELTALVLLLTRPEVAVTEPARQILELLRDPGIRQIYGVALDALRAGGRPDVPAWLDSGPADIRESVSAALMEGRWDTADMIEERVRAMATEMSRRRIDEEITLAERQYREALSRGNEEDARALSVRCIELKQTRLGLANQSRGMTT
jgi:hypothetical protein